MTPRVPPGVAVNAVESDGRILLEDGSGEWLGGRWVALERDAARAGVGRRLVVVTLDTPAGTLLLDRTRTRMWDGQGWAPAPAAAPAVREARPSRMSDAMARRRALAWKGLDKEYTPDAPAHVAGAARRRGAR